MATTERARITGFFVIGFLVGLITMLALAKSGTLKIKADVVWLADKDKVTDCMKDLGYEDKDGDGDIDRGDYGSDNASFNNDYERCLTINQEPVEPWWL